MNEITELLDSLGIEYVKHNHPPVFTSAEAESHWGVVNAAHVKNLFLRNKDKSQYYLVVVDCEKRVDLKALHKALGESRFSFGKPEQLKEYLNVTPGSVSAFGALFDNDHKVKFVIDEALFSEERLGLHPNHNEWTYEVPVGGLVTYFEHLDTPWQKLDVPEM